MGLGPLRVILDTNILVSSFNFGGKPRQILLDVLEGGIIGVTSEVLIAELIDVLSKKFRFSGFDLQLVELEIRKNFELVIPAETIKILEDDSDNRVLEAARAGGCDFIVTGDKDLLKLKKYKGIKILPPSNFLELK